MSDLNARFDALRALRTELGAEEARELSESELAEINDSLSMSLTREQIATLIETSDTTLDSVFSDAIAMVEEILTATLPEGQESNALRSVRDDLSGLYSEQLTTIVVDAVARLHPAEHADRRGDHRGQPGGRAAKALSR